MPVKTCIFSLLMISAVFPFSLPGQAESTNELFLDSVVVTAKRYAHAVNASSMTVSVVGKKESRLHNAYNVIELVNHEANALTEKTGMVGRNDISIRGLGNKGTMIGILVDGRPDKMGLFGCAVTHSFLMENIERVEVIRGPASLMYGSDAVAGVINIITREPVRPLEARLGIAYGSYNTRNASVEMAGSLEKFRYSLSGVRILSDDFRPLTEFGSGIVNLKAGYRFNPHMRVTAETRYFKGEKKEPGLDDIAENNQNYIYERSGLDVSFYGSWKKYNNSLKLYRNYGNHRFTTGWRSLDHINGFVFQNDLKLFAFNRLSLGFEAKELFGKKLNSPGGEWFIHEYAPYLYNEFLVTERLTFMQGLRYSRASIFSHVLSPHLGIVFSPFRATRFRMNYNHGYRMPQISELYTLPASNPDLKPEYFHNYEIGADQRVFSWFSVESVFFYMEGGDIIEPVRVSSLPSYVKFMNNSLFFFKGWENTLTFILSKSFKAVLNLAHNDFGRHTTGRFRNKADMKFLCFFKNLEASLMGQYVGRYYAGSFSTSRLPDYFILNAKAVYSTGYHLDVFLEANNILDREYMIYVNLPEGTGPYPAPGINFHSGVSYHY